LLLARDRRSFRGLTKDVIRLANLSRDEVLDLLGRHGEVLSRGSGEKILARLSELGGGLLLALISDFVQSGVAPSWDVVLGALGDFETRGILGPDGQPIPRGSAARSRIAITVSAVNDELLAMLRRNPELLRQLEPRKFEELVAELLTRQGYDVTLTPPSRDGGFDMYAAKQDGLGRFLYLVETKRYVPSHKVGVEVVRALHGVVQARQATAGAVVSTSFFTTGAEEYRRRIQYQMHLHDYIALQRWLDDLRFPRKPAAARQAG
jgi:restriction system protein